MKQSATRLVTGQREAVKVVIPSGRDVGPVAGATSRRIFADSIDVAELFMQDSMRWRIVPNTYEMWWETDGIWPTASSASMRVGGTKTVLPPLERWG